MKTYLDTTRFAAEAIIRSYISEFNELNALVRAYNANNAAARVASSQPESTASRDLHSFIAQFQRARELSLEIHQSANALSNREAATAVLCGSLLQMAKQGLSSVHGAPANWPEGRKIGAQALSVVIQQARNQAIHWEESKPLYSEVENCFNTLDADFGTSLSVDLKNKSQATAVIDRLGWHSYHQYEADMLLMA